MIEVELKGLKKVMDGAKESLPPKLWRRFFADMARGVVQMNAKRIKAQENLDGTAFDPRKTDKKGKMEKRVMPASGKNKGGRWMIIRRATASGFSVFTNNKVLARQQEGGSTKVKASDLKQKESKKLSRKQHRWLWHRAQELGFDGSFRSFEKLFPTKKQALAYILRLDDRKGGDRSWTIKNADRDILGVNASNIKTMIERARAFVFRHFKI